MMTREHLDDETLLCLLMQRDIVGGPDSLSDHLRTCASCADRQEALRTLALGFQELADASSRASLPGAVATWSIETGELPHPDIQNSSGGGSLSPSSFLFRWSRRVTLPFIAATIGVVSFLSGRAWEKAVSAEGLASPSPIMPTDPVLSVQRASSALTSALDSLSAIMDSLPRERAVIAREVALSASIATLGAQSRVDPISLARVLRVTNAVLQQSGTSEPRGTRLVFF